MTDTPQKPIKARPAVYATIWEGMLQVARDRGYALGLHGSMQRDLDVIAVPWVDQAAAPEDLVAALVEEVEGFVIDGADPVLKPHGRLSWVIHLGFRGCYIDLSIMPRALG